MNETLKKLTNDYGRLLAYAAFAVLVLLALFLLAKTVDAFDRMGKSPYAGPNVISVSGTGKAQTPPTIARVLFTTQETAATVAEAQERASTRTRTALEAVRALGIEDADVQAASYQTYPQYAQPQPCVPGAICNQGNTRIVAYQVSQSVTVKIRNTDAAGEVLQALGNAGVQNIQGPNFEVDDDSAVMEEARGEAIKDARDNARMLARQLGVNLGDVVSFSESGTPYPMPAYGMGGGVMMDATSARSEKAVPLPQGQNESVVTVTVTYEIE
ncbi:MAG TPA: SIMPL domain-containing protein [Candidatus Paceibacterota bacterium]|jgi:hypothetical protein